MSPPRLLWPVPRYLPFQPENGIQTSILMFESEVGVNVAATRQNAGRLPKAPPSGAATVIVVSGKLMLAKLAHDAALAGVEAMPTSGASKAVASAGALWMHLMAILPFPQFTYRATLIRPRQIPVVLA